MKGEVTRFNWFLSPITVTVPHHPAVLNNSQKSTKTEGDTRGPAEEARGRSLAALEKGDRVKMSDFMGRGFASLFVGWIGLQSALQVLGLCVGVASAPVVGFP